MKKLTDHNGNPVWVNLSQAIHMKPSNRPNGGTMITFGTSAGTDGPDILLATVLVKEEGDEITGEHVEAVASTSFEIDRTARRILDFLRDSPESTSLRDIYRKLRISAAMAVQGAERLTAEGLVSIAATRPKGGGPTTIRLVLT